MMVRIRHGGREVELGVNLQLVGDLAREAAARLGVASGVVLLARDGELLDGLLPARDVIRDGDKLELLEIGGGA